MITLEALGNAAAPPRIARPRRWSWVARTSRAMTFIF